MLLLQALLFRSDHPLQGMSCGFLDGGWGGRVGKGIQDVLMEDFLVRSVHGVHFVFDTCTGDRMPVEASEMLHRIDKL